MLAKLPQAVNDIPSTRPLTKLQTMRTMSARFVLMSEARYRTRPLSLILVSVPCFWLRVSSVLDWSLGATNTERSNMSDFPLSSGNLFILSSITDASNEIKYIGMISPEQPTGLPPGSYIYTFGTPYQDHESLHHKPYPAFFYRLLGSIILVISNFLVNMQIACMPRH